MPKHSKQTRKHGRKPFHNAPLQGIGETYDWTVNDVQSIAIPLIGPNIYGIRGCVDVNGFSWSVTQAGGLIGASGSTTPYNQGLYGQNNSQFQRLASLWQEYRTDMISYEFQPVAAGGNINMTSMVTVVDESGSFQGTPPLVDVAEKYSSMRNVNLHSPYKVIKQKLRLTKWLGQTQDRAWIQTQAPDTTQIIREVYPTFLNTTSVSPSALLSRTPALGFVGGFNSTEVAGSSVILGVIKFVTRFVFRQRRPLDSDPFLDQTLLYSKDGMDYIAKLDPSRIQEIIDHFSLHKSDPVEIPDIKQEIEEKPKAPDLSKSTILGLFETLVQRPAINHGYPPQYLEGRVGEASNPGPVVCDAEDCIAPE